MTIEQAISYKGGGFFLEKNIFSFEGVPARVGMATLGEVKKG